jgi:hypothetical protein
MLWYVASQFLVERTSGVHWDLRRTETSPCKVRTRWNSAAATRSIPTAGACTGEHLSRGSTFCFFPSVLSHYFLSLSYFIFKYLMDQSKVQQFIYINVCKILLSTACFGYCHHQVLYTCFIAKLPRCNALSYFITYYEDVVPV